MRTLHIASCADLRCKVDGVPRRGSKPRCLNFAGRTSVYVLTKGHTWWDSHVQFNSWTASRNMTPVHGPQVSPQLVKSQLLRVLIGQKSRPPAAWQHRSSDTLH